MVRTALRGSNELLSSEFLPLEPPRLSETSSTEFRLEVLGYAVSYPYPKVRGRLDSLERVDPDVAVPEPGAAALFALGAGLVLVRTRRRGPRR